MNETKNNITNLNKDIFDNVQQMQKIDNEVLSEYKKKLSLFQNEIPDLESFGQFNESIKEIEYEEIFTICLKFINEATKYANKIDFKNIYKKNILGRFLGFPADVDSDGARLYNSIFFLKFYYENIIPKILEKIDILLLDFDLKVRRLAALPKNNAHDAIILSQFISLKNLKINYTILNNCASAIINNPYIAKFYMEWTEYKDKKLRQR